MAAPKLTLLDQLIAAGEDARLELVDGELSAVETTGEHADAQLGVGAPIRQAYHRRPGGDGAPGGWWIVVECTIQFTISEVLRPDLAGWRRERCPERPSGFPVRVTPDWVCEVLLPGTSHRDLGHKRRVYHAAKVGHYWLVDAEREEVTVLRWTLEGYVVHEIDVVHGAFRAPPFEAVAIELSSLFGKE